MKPDFNKGLIPAIIQDHKTGKVLMQAYMDQEAFEKTRSEGKVTFFSRSKNRLWTKGEESGNYLHVREILLDCDRDSILIKVKPDGPVCHTGSDTCWNEKNTSPLSILLELEDIIKDRKENPAEGSYTTSLFEKGINAIAQKVGEEAVELVIEAKDDNPELFLNEAADLMYHFMILLNAKELVLEQVTEILKTRMK
jgi:phosphoribosyl-ATP pyrophosphohydrolase/phosphoribosyl-AMP cyclohydrolase